MRILLVNAYPAASAQGCERFARFRSFVLSVVDELERSEVTRVELIEKHRDELDDFLYELRGSEFGDPHAITRFDRLDFVLVDGDENSSPWAPRLRKLALLTKLCMMTGKCFFAGGLGAALLAYVGATGGELLRVLNNNGKGDVVVDFPPPPDVPTSNPDRDVLLDIKTGDFFAYSERQHGWEPRGNTGLVLHSSDSARAFGARPNSARAGAKQPFATGSHSLYLSRRGETRCCVRLEAAHDPVLRAAFPEAPREFVLRCTGRWDVDEEIGSTGANKCRVLIDSARGPMLLEFGNCLGAHFQIDSAYPETLSLLRNFVRIKASAVREHAHLDRSLVTAVSGENARIRDRLVMAQTKRGTGVSVSRPLSASGRSRHDEKPVTGSGMSPGKSSPKRCRPVSAGPRRSKPSATTQLRAVHTARDVLPTSGLADQDNNSRHDRAKTNRGPEPGKDFQSPRTSETYPEIDELDTTAHREQEDHIPANKPRVIRVPQKNEREKPYCAFRQRRDPPDGDNNRNTGGANYYSIVNDAPYMSAFEREMLDHQKSKLKWTAGPFRAAIGKASTQVVPEPGIFARAPFVQKNTPFYIIQRRGLEEEERKQPQQPHQARQQRPTPPSARPTESRRNWRS